MTFRPSNAAPNLAVLAIVLVTAGAYAGGYFWLATRHEYGRPPWLVERGYASPSIARVFVLAAQVESKIRGVEVAVGPLVTEKHHPGFFFTYERN